MQTHLVIPSALSPKLCAEIRGLACRQRLTDGLVGHGGENVLHDMRRSAIRWCDATAAEWSGVKAIFDKLSFDANAKLWGCDARGFTSMQFAEYAAWDEGHYDWHRDDNPSPATERWTAFDRVLSIVALLSSPTEFSGGTFEVEDGTGHARAVELKQGDVVVFPSSVRHRVTPVTAGVRHSLVAWSLGPRPQVLKSPSKKRRST